MRKSLIFLLLFSGVLSFGTLCRALNVLTQPECTATNDSTSEFLMCVGFPSDPASEQQQILHLKGLIDALLDVFVFVNSGLDGVPLLNISAGWNFNSTALLQDNDVITAWLQIRLTPLLSSISQNFLTCLGYNNFSCQTYQTVVQELSQQFSSLDAQRQQWIYSYFMQPFLSKNTPEGCVIPGDTTVDWVTKNFGSFSVLAQIRDFSSINGFFNVLDVLHLLTPEQKAQLMLYPETSGLNKESLSVVLRSLLRSLPTSGGAVNSLNGTMQEDHAGLSMYSASLQDPLGQTVNDIMTAFRPVGSFVREFVSLTHQKDLSSMRSATLIQAMLNWTLAELAAPYKNTSSNQQLDQMMFNATDVNLWFTHVVVPVLNRYLTSDMISEDLAAVFHNVFYMQNPVNETQETCSVSLDGACAVANVMEHVAKVLQCAGSTNLTFTQETVTSLVLHLSKNLNTLLNQITNTNFSSEDSSFRDILDQIHNPTHTDLTDKAFITMWFHIKLKPLLSTVTPDYLLCLSAKPFSCQTFQTLVWEMSNNMFLIPVNKTQVVYENFIKPFLLQQNTTGGCMSNSSLEWILRNLGGFSEFATVQEMYLLNPEFDALEAFSALNLKQISEIIVEDLPQLPAKQQLIDITFSNMLTSPTMRQHLPQLIFLISEMNTMKNCLIYQEIFSWLHFASLSANPEAEYLILMSINNLMKATPSDCRSYTGMCNTTSINGSTVCDGVNSDDLMDYLKTPHNGSQLCSFNITQYACAQVTDISAEDLVIVLSCYLYGNEVVSEKTWKIFLKKISPALGPALDLFTNQTIPLSRPLVVNMLDVITDVTFSTFTPSSFTNLSLIQLWFGNRLRPFLPYASPNFLSCISRYNFNCETYQSIVQSLSQQVNVMSNETQMSVYVYFIYKFLSNNQTAGCNVGGQSSDWLKQNFGSFAEFATITELQDLNPDFSVMDVLDSLSVTQLVEVCTSPGLITSAAQVVQVLNNVPDPDLSMFFSKLSSTLTVGAVTLPTEVSETFLQQVFVRVNLEDPKVPDSEVEKWINIGIKPFISNIQIPQIPLYFNILTQHSCIISQQGVMVLNSAHSSFNSDTLQTIYNQIIISLSGSELMKCYTNQSFYTFLKSYFIGFQFPSLSTFLSLIPPGHKAEFLNSISPAELSDLLHNIGTEEDLNKLCDVFNIYNQTETYLQSVTDLSAETLATVLSCYLYGNDVISNKTWKIFLTGVGPVLGPALDLFPIETIPLSRPLVVNMLDVITDVTFSTFTPSSFTNLSLIQLWFGNRLRPFLPYASPNFLSCISRYNFNCETYQSIVQSLSQQVNVMSNETQMSVYVYFIHKFLSNNQTAGCNVGDQSSDWLKQNFGSFAEFATITELQDLNPDFSVMDVLDSLSVTQLVEVCTSPGLITSAAQVVQVLNNVPDPDLSMFFSKLSSTLTVGAVTLPTEVSETFLQQVFVRVNLEDPKVPDSEVEKWINIGIKPFISNIQIPQIPLYFNILTQHSCIISQQGVMVLNSAHSSFNSDTLQTIYNQIIISLSGSELMKCYTNQSFYTFLKSYFIGFQFPSLSTFLSLIPPGHKAEFLNSMSPGELSDLLNNSSTVDQNKLCEVFNIYNQTETYLQSEPVLSPDLATQTLTCVWPQAISATSQADIDRWFNVTLVQYLPYLSSQMVSSTQMDGASCMTFSKFVSVFGSYDFDTAAFTKNDIYTTIQSYLTTENPPKCYDPTDPMLNSTAWFYQYIGVFISFITVDDLQQFGGLRLEQFTPNPQNLELFSKYNVSQDVLNLYADMLFYVEPSTNIKLLPLQLWCSAPASAFSNLSQSDAVSIIKSLHLQCTDIDPTVSAALAGDVDILTEDGILALGNSITGLSVGQISDSSPSALLSSLTFLSSVVGWSESQAMAVIQSLLSSGLFTITSVQSLQLLGSLLIGVPSTLFNDISAESLLTALQSQTFLNNIVNSPVTTQQIIVNQIISMNSNPDSVVQNVPDNMAQLIPRPSLLFLSQQTATTLNQKQWTSNQAMLLFDVVAEEFNNADNISFQVLQGFTCTRAQRFSTQKVKDLIRGCRRRGNNKVALQESQLTCMYNYIRSDSVTAFTDYPADMLLYYNVSQVQPSICKSYYSALGKADFSMFSSTLSYRKDDLFRNALQCLGVSGFSVSQTQLDVMGNMVCVFNSSYILNSDPYVLEKLKLCPTLTADQSSAVESVLLRGNTVYGAPVSWNQTILPSLGVLPLYLTSNFWSYFTQKEKVDFLRVFVPGIKEKGISREMISTLIFQAGKASKTRSISLLRLRRDTACTVGEITQIQASDASFPFGYDVNQFDACLSVQTLKDNLAAITDKATGSDFQRIILNKLNQAYPAGISDQVLRVLGPASRAASVSDINKWNVTSIDTLTALMRSYDGAWSSEQVRSIVSRYMSGSRTLGSSELNALGGTNLCALDINLLKTITSSSLQLADPLSVSNCSLEQKQVLFNIAQIAFNNQTLRTSTRTSSTVSSNIYQLIQTYLGGADISFVRTLSSSNISMELLTFITLNQNVINNLTVSEVQGLLGTNLPDLKTYENNPVVHSWITQQLQSDLDTLGIGLIGGRGLPSTNNANNNTTASANTTSSTNVNATTIKPTAAGSSIFASSGLQKLLLLFHLGVTMATLQLVY